MKIKTKLYLSAVISIILISLLALLLFQLTNEVKDELKKAELADELVKGTTELTIITEEYIAHHERRMEQQWKSKFNSITKMIKKEEETPVSDEIRTDLESLNNSFYQLRANFEKRQELLKENASKDEVERTIVYEERLAARMRVDSVRIWSNAFEIAKESRQRTSALQQKANFELSIFGILLFIVVGTTMVTVARSISKPIDELVRGAKIVGGGNLDHRIEIKSRDETGYLSQAFNEMVEKRKRAEETIHQRSKDLNILNTVIMDVTSSLNLKEVLEKVTKNAAELLGADAGSVAIYDEKSEVMTYPCHYNMPKDLTKVVAKKGRGLAEYVMKTGSPVIIENYPAHPRALKEFVGAGLKVLAVVPLISKGRAFGALGVFGMTPEKRFTERQLKLLEGIGRQAAIAIENAKLFDEIKRFSETLEQKVEERTRDLRESEEKYRGLIETANDVVFSLDLAGNFQLVNKKAEEITGYSSDEIIGKNFAKMGLIAPEDVETTIEQFKQRIKGVPGKSYEIEIIKKGGERVPMELSTSAIRRNGKVIGVQGIARDITERKRLERKLQEHLKTIEEANERLKELDKLKSMFIASMSHELRTPLNSIIGFTGIILQGLSGAVTQEMNDELQIVYDSGKHLLDLINDVIDISKIEADKIDIYFEDVDLGGVLEEAVMAVSKDAEEKRLKIVTDFPEELLIKADRRRLLQCVLNILSNAVKFTEKGTIELKAIKKDVTLEISVSDTGVGIQSEDISKLFTPFTRLDSPLKEKTLGTGLGLYLTKKLMTSVFQGDIRVESVYGKGSTFTLIIPLEEVIG